MQESGALQQKFSKLSSPNKLLGEASLVPDGLPITGKKRERPDHNADEVVGLSDARAVEELLARMKQKQTSSQRSTIAATIKATTREECLRTFVHLGGVSLLDDWIQDGAMAMASNSAGHKVVNPEMMMIMMILQALEKLPIDLETLKGCSIGKSVNHLHRMKDVEVQTKARKMVDVWKKRVENEMKYSIALPSSKSGEIAEEAMVAASKITIMEKARVAVDGEALAMANSTSDVSSKADDKSEEKDESKNCSSSITSTSLFTTAIRQEHSAAMAMETLNAEKGEDNKDETGNLRQKHAAASVMGTLNAVKGKDVKDETSNVRQKHSAAMAMETWNAVKRKAVKDEPSNGKIELDGHGNGHDSTPATTHVKERANECSPAIAQWSIIDLPTTNASPSQEVTKKHDKMALQNNRSIDGNAGDSEQQHVELSRSPTATKVDSAELVNELPSWTSTRSGGREEATTKTHVEEENHVRVSCLSSQSNLQILQPQGPPFRLACNEDGAVFRRTMKGCGHHIYGYLSHFMVRSRGLTRAFYPNTYDWYEIVSSNSSNESLDQGIKFCKLVAHIPALHTHLSSKWAVIGLRE